MDLSTRGPHAASRGRPCYDASVVAFARWDPFRDITSIQLRLERLAASASHEWVPAVDLAETDTDFIVTAELPGVTREQIRLDVRDGRLTIQGRRRARVSCEQFHQMERGHGEFCRTLILPQAVDASGIVADLIDGVLTITVPKASTPVARRVTVT